MATNILELLKNEFSDDLIGKLGKFVGEDSTKTKSALGSIFPAVLGALIINPANRHMNFVTRHRRPCDA